MTHGLPRLTVGNVGTVANSCIVTEVMVEATNHSQAASVTLFKGIGAHGVANKIGVVTAGPGVVTNSVDYGEDGLLAQDGLQCVTTANVTWSGIAYRHYAG